MREDEVSEPMMAAAFDNQAELVMAEFRDTIIQMSHNTQMVPVDARTRGMLAKLVDQMARATYEALHEKYYPVAQKPQ